MTLEPIWNQPALTFARRTRGADERYLVASELHLGIEGELARRGAYLRSRSATLAERLLALAREHQATRLILLGDVKHRIAGLSRQERRDVPAFFEALSPFDSIDVALGNHDVGLASLLPRRSFPDVRLHPAGGFLVPSDEGPVACLHGHAWPARAVLSARTFLVGHTHAAAAFVDEQGQPRTEWAWVRGRLAAAPARARYGRPLRARAIVFPPFNPLCGGTPVNREGLLGPFARLLDPASTELYLLDGRSLGSIPPDAWARRARRTASREN